MAKKNRKPGFTMVELMIALIVTSVVLSAVAVLANATTVATEKTEQMGCCQSELRQVSMRLSDLIRRANGVLNASSEEFYLWHDADGDGLAPVGELTRVARGADGHTLTIGSGETHSACRTVVFAYDTMPEARFVTVWFDLTENGLTQRYSVSAGVRGSDEHRQF
jgi:prepilin-type N-terminal cleavage/methylation domain-containing protein